MAVSNGVVKKIVLSYTYVAIWIFLSSTIIVYNKYILDREMYNWSPLNPVWVFLTFSVCFSHAILILSFAAQLFPHIPAKRYRFQAFTSQSSSQVHYAYFKTANMMRQWL
ncbi:hypothetical protein PIB30_056520 [Stylosanthes scabra]|uniref:Uncharacterized protein n=1 Tax=Stylosanthes scabra TaxID=79078 RepID=A0ABU6QJC2_9FABA|nr:hypothetical protein [Stylosanthes scabra]